MSPKMTMPTQALLRELLAEPTRLRYGLELIDLTGLQSGTLYPLLARLEVVGWLESAWEDPREQESAGRPRRRYYRLTRDGAEQARHALALASERTRRGRASGALRPGHAGGAQ